MAALDVDDPEKVAYITQTTLSPDDVAGVVDALSDALPVRRRAHTADICYATQNRQDAVVAIAGECDLDPRGRLEQLVERRPPGRGGRPGRVPRGADRGRDATRLGLLAADAHTVGVTAGRVDAAAPSWTGWSPPCDLVARVEERVLRTRTRHFPPTCGGPLNGHPPAPEHQDRRPTWPARSWPGGTSSRSSSSSNRSSPATSSATAAARSSTRPRSCASGSPSSRRWRPSRSAGRRWCRSPAASRCCTPRSTR